MTDPTTLESVAAQLAALDDKLSARIREEEAIMSGAFPDGDWNDHRQVHERMIAAAEEERRFWAELRLDLAKKGMWGLFLILLGLMVYGLAAKFGIKVAAP